MSESVHRICVVLELLPGGAGLRGRANPQHPGGTEATTVAAAEVLHDTATGRVHVTGFPALSEPLVLSTGPAGAAVQSGDELTVVLDPQGGAGLAVRRATDLLFAWGDMKDLEHALALPLPPDSGYTRVDLRVGTAVARREIVASRDELAFWLGHFVGTRRGALPPGLTRPPG